MDHVIAPLDTDHARVVRQLSVDLAAALSIDHDDVALRPPHITLASYTGLEPVDAATALAPVVAVIAPFTVRAHGYGLFTGDADTDLSLHVMVVRTKALDELHRCVTAALCAAGAHLAGTTEPRVWTPHITLLDRGLTPRLLGRAVEMLASRPHRTWSITLESLAVTHHCAADAGPLTMELGGATRVCRDDRDPVDQAVSTTLGCPTGGTTSGERRAEGPFCEAPQRATIMAWRSTRSTSALGASCGSHT